ncbi:Fe(3+)-dicitrate ABC transporter ATP-binding protein, partial [Pseudomonas sp. MWU13-2860]
MTTLSLKLSPAAIDPALPASGLPRLSGDGLRLGYRQRTICEQLNPRIPDGSF